MRVIQTVCMTTQGIFNRHLIIRYFVQYAMLFKTLEDAVKSYTVHFFAADQFVHLSMRKRLSMLQKALEYGKASASFSKIMFF